MRVCRGDDLLLRRIAQVGYSSFETRPGRGLNQTVAVTPATSQTLELAPPISAPTSAEIALRRAASICIAAPMKITVCRSLNASGGQRLQPHLAQHARPPAKSASASRTAPPRRAACSGSAPAAAPASAIAQFTGRPVREDTSLTRHRYPTREVHMQITLGTRS